MKNLEKWKKSASVLPILRIVLPKFSPEKIMPYSKGGHVLTDKKSEFTPMVKVF
jgi:hypothetical protein